MIDICCIGLVFFSWIYIYIYWCAFRKNDVPVKEGDDINNDAAVYSESKAKEWERKGKREASERESARGREAERENNGREWGGWYDCYRERLRYEIEYIKKKEIWKCRIMK